MIPIVFLFVAVLVIITVGLLVAMSSDKQSNIFVIKQEEITEVSAEDMIFILNMLHPSDAERVIQRLKLSNTIKNALRSGPGTSEKSVLE